MGAEILNTPDEPDAPDASPVVARPCGEGIGDGFVECVGLGGWIWPGGLKCPM